MFGTSLDGLFLVDDGRRFSRVNQRASELLGAPAAEIVKRRIEDFTPDENMPLLDEIWADFERRGSIEGRYEVLRGDGSRAVLEYRGTWDFAPGEHLVSAREAAGAEGPAQSGAPPLSERERQVLQLAADGRSTREIAKALFLSPGTVKTHFQHAYKKLGAHDGASAVAECLRRGLIQ